MKTRISLLTLALATASVACGQTDVAGERPSVRAGSSEPVAVTPVTSTSADIAPERAAPPVAVPTPPSAVSATEAVSPPATEMAREAKAPSSAARRSGAPPLVVFNRDVVLSADDHRAAVVVIGGSATVAGKVDDAIVAIGGDVKASGPVGDAVVAILGNVALDARAKEAVAIGGGVELGPRAEVRDVVSIGGPIQRDPASRLTGSASELAFFDAMPDFRGLRAWLRHALLLARPLAFHADLLWAWQVAAVILGLYVLVGLLFPRPVTACVETLEQRPGGTVLTTLLAFLLSPVLMVLLTITVIGPIIFLGALLLAGLIGKTAILAWMGRRTLGGLGLGTSWRAALAVLVGGVILALLYAVPVLGMLLWHLTVALGLGLAILTLVRASRATNGGAAAVSPSRPAEVGAGPTVGGHARESTAVPATAPSEPVSGTTLPQSTASEAALALALPSTYPRAGFWVRTMALAIDGLIVMAVASAIFLKGSILLVLLAAYGAVMWKFRGTTVGGIVFGLKVVRLDDRPVDWPTAIVRALASFLSLFAAGLGFLWVIWDAERQAWHDKIAGTVVVRVPRGVSLV